MTERKQRASYHRQHRGNEARPIARCAYYSSSVVDEIFGLGLLGAGATLYGLDGHSAKKGEAADAQK